MTLVAHTANSHAADMTAAEITKLVSGNTVYVAFEASQVNSGAGEGALYYSADGKVSRARRSP